MDYLDKTTSLTPEARKIICFKATEYPHTGQYESVVSRGSYLCRRCGLALFRANSQFSSGCGWPSFDVDISGAVTSLPDQDGRRTEILCARCDAHLGHVFTGEGYTANNRRYCVNAASLDFVLSNTVLDSEEAIVAGGCFWGVDYYFRQMPCVLGVESGYTGGSLENPSYQQICHGHSGHYEAVRILYDPSKTDYETVLKLFFEIHDPTQKNGQGPDFGHQYQSAVFCYNKNQRNITEGLIHRLRQKGFDVATHVLEVSPFWPAEEYHQNYYAKHQKIPYCHARVPRF